MSCHLGVESIENLPISKMVSFCSYLLERTNAGIRFTHNQIVVANRILDQFVRPLK